MPSVALRHIAALIALCILWMVLQLFLNAAFALLGASRGDGPTWFAFMKDLVSPGVAAYLSFSIVSRFLQRAPWRLLASGFVVALIAYTVWSIGYNAEHFLLAQRTEEWRHVFLATLLATAAALVGTAVFTVQHRSES